MNLYLIRHAESVNNARFRDADVVDLSLRDPDPALTSLGHVQAQHLAHFVVHAAELEHAAIPIEVWDDVH